MSKALKEVKGSAVLFSVMTPPDGQAQSGQVTAIGATIDYVWILRIRRDMATLAAGRGFPIGFAYSSASSPVIDSYRRVVLLPAK